MSKTVCIANQKGGVGKTTTTVNLAAALVKRGKKVLCVDLDPQANMSEYLGHEYDTAPTISDLMQAAATMQPFDVFASIHKNHEGISYIPSDITLASADVFLATAMCRENTLKRLLSHEATSSFDYILIDCLPSLGILLTNALAASDTVVIPVQAQKFSYGGLVQLREVISLVQTNLNPTLYIEGILLTMADNTVVSKSVQAALEESQRGEMYETIIHRRTEASQSTIEMSSMVSNEKSFLGAEYLALADEYLKKEAAI